MIAKATLRLLSIVTKMHHNSKRIMCGIERRCAGRAGLQQNAAARDLLRSLQRIRLPACPLHRDFSFRCMSHTPISPKRIPQASPRLGVAACDGNAIQDRGTHQRKVGLGYLQFSSAKVSVSICSSDGLLASKYCTALLTVSEAGARGVSRAIVITDSTRLSTTRVSETSRQRGPKW